MAERESPTTGVATDERKVCVICGRPYAQRTEACTNWVIAGTAWAQVMQRTGRHGNEKSFPNDDNND